MKHLKKVLLPLLLFLVSLPLLWLLCAGVKMWFHLDFSQSYRSVPGVESIVFWDSREKQAYTRTFWGLKKAAAPTVFSEPDTARQEEAAAILAEHIQHGSSACVLDIALVSPDGRYIVYREVEYNYYKSDMTDDEACTYRVFDIETGRISTIYKGYREWFRLDWQ